MLTKSEMNRTVLDLVDGLSSSDMFNFILHLANEPIGMREVNRFNLLKWMNKTGKEINHTWGGVPWNDREVFAEAFR